MERIGIQPLQYTAKEIGAGVFVMLGVAALAYLSVSIGGATPFGQEQYPVTARFASVGELKEDAPVKIAGVRVGRVEAITLEGYVAQVELRIDHGVQLPKDTIASIRTAGVLGSSYVLLSPGPSLENLAAGDRILQTEPAVDLIDLLIKYGLESDDEGAPDAGKGPVGPDFLEE